MKDVSFTLGIIKPNAVRKSVIGNIIAEIEDADFKIIEMKMVKLTKEQAEKFYAEHCKKSFFQELIEFMISGECVVMSLMGENAVDRFKKLIGATNPHIPSINTIRGRYGEKGLNYTGPQNVIHGSDSQESAHRELNFFFSK